MGTEYRSKDKNAKEGYKTTLKRAMAHLPEMKSHSKALSKAKGKDDWAEKHGQVKGEQLKGTITGRKFGQKKY